MKHKTKELLNEIKDLYINAGYGYRKISKYLQDTKGLKISHITIKNWIAELHIKPHEGKKIKKFSLAWYKKIYKKLKKENMELKEAQERLKVLEKEFVNIKTKLNELEKAREKDRELINYMFKTIFKNCELETIIEVKNTYNKIMNFKK